jgi:hypothetical protein
VHLPGGAGEAAKRSDLQEALDLADGDVHAAFITKTDEYILFISIVT